MIVSITRKIDSKGRVNIPTNVLALLGWDENTEVRFEVSKTGSLILREVPNKKNIELLSLLDSIDSEE